jgi:adenylylsulfate kinase
VDNSATRSFQDNQEAHQGDQVDTFSRTESETSGQTQRHLQRVDGAISIDDRAQLFSQQAATIWLTGLSGAGKSTIAYELERQLIALGHACYVLDGDNIRHGLGCDLSFTPADRHENIRRVAHVASLMNNAGLIVITALISPMHEDRAMAREIIGRDRYVETYLAASVDECARRDPKGLYAKAKAGEIPAFTGISAPYEPPVNPNLSIDTSRESKEESVAKIFKYLSSTFFISR